MIPDFLLKECLEQMQCVDTRGQWAAAFRPREKNIFRIYFNKNHKKNNILFLFTLKSEMTKQF
jgi:hypothetical protein